MKNVFRKNNFFIWSGVSAEGKKMKGVIEALSFDSAKLILKEQGITPILITKKRKNLFTFDKKISTFDIALLFRQLATLLSSGIPIVQSCEILKQTQEKTNLKLLINDIKCEMEAGKNFVTGLKNFPCYFDNLTCNLIYAGEQTGTLESMLKRIAYDKEKSLKLKNQLKEALFYPAIVLSVAIIVSVIMLTLIVPRFSELFQNMHSQLPAFTQLIVQFSIFFRSNIWLGTFPLIGLFLFIFLFKKFLKFRKRIDFFVLKIPFFNTILKKIILARFMRNLAITFSAGVPITDALILIAEASGNYAYTEAIISLKTHIALGQQLHVTMQKNPLFPILSVQMIKIGEESGQLQEMLNKVAELYENDIHLLIANLSHLLEPLIMVILGVLIGGLVIALYLPIFKLGTII